MLFVVPGLWGLLGGFPTLPCSADVLPHILGGCDRVSLPASSQVLSVRVFSSYSWKFYWENRYLYRVVTLLCPEKYNPWYEQ